MLVPNLPDIGITPSFRAGGAAAMGQGTALATAYNDALFGGLAANGLRVIPVDTFHFLQEVVADPGTLLSLVPVFLIFVFFQRYLVQGIATTGLKG